MKGWRIFVAIGGASSLAIACNLLVDASKFEVVPTDAGTVSPTPDAGNRVDARTFDATHPADVTMRDATHEATVPADAGRDHAVADASSDGSAVDALREATIVDAVPVCAPDADFTSDPENCGRCNHGCLGAGCVASACQPQAVAIGTGTPTFLTVAGGNVYWTQASGNQIPNALLSAAAGGGIAITLEVLPGQAQGVTTDTQRLYWGVANNNNNPYGVYACPLAGCTDAGPQLLAPAIYLDSNDNLQEDSVNGFTVASGVIYSVQQHGYLRECPVPAVDGGCKQVASGLYNPYSPKADDAGVVWANQGQQNDYTSGSIQTCLAPPFGSCENPPIEGDDIQPEYLALDGTHVYWTEYTNNANGRYVGNVMECTRSKCEVSTVTLATNQSNPQGIASDEANVYWVDTSSGSVLACPIAGCPDGGPTVLAAPDGGAPFQVALDSTAVYWTNSVQGGAVMRVAKP